MMRFSIYCIGTFTIPEQSHFLSKRSKAWTLSIKSSRLINHLSAERRDQIQQRILACSLIFATCLLNCQKQRSADIKPGVSHSTLRVDAVRRVKALVSV